MAREYIDKKATLKILDCMAQSEATRGAATICKVLIKARNTIANIADSNVVHIVRCWECKNRGTEACPMVYYDNLGTLVCPEKDNDFCSYGEKLKHVSNS